MTIVVGTMNEVINNGRRCNPYRFLFASIFLAAIDYSFNFMVFGLLISLGMLIDGCVVVVEYADRKMAEGFDRIEAYKFSAKRMFLTCNDFYRYNIINFCSNVFMEFRVNF